MINKIIKNILSFLFPQKCLGCGEKNTLLCSKCLSRIDMPTLPKDGNIFSAADYSDEIVKKAIWALKYRHAKNLAEPLAELLNTRCMAKLKIDKIENWLLVPIPLSMARLKERGYNQAEEIAKHLSSPRLSNNVLCKIKETPSQVSIKNKKERIENLNGAFVVKNPELVKNKNVILVDDVSTTGATISEAHKVLRASGAKKVIAMVVARG